jgi:hypothetical protein
MLNKQFYEEKLDEISDALDASPAWYNQDEYDKIWQEGFLLGCFAGPGIIAGVLGIVAGIWLFIHWAAQP